MASKIIDYNGEKYNISYEIVNSNMPQSILFLHGWGSDKNLMKKSFGASFKHLTHIYVDLPGFGNSSISRPLNSYEYGAIITKFLNEIPQNPSIFIGHSFGGKIVSLLNPEVLVLLSSAGIVQKKSLIVFLKIKIFKFLNFFKIARFFRKNFISKDAKNMSEVMYQTFKNVVDEDFTNIFANVNSYKKIIFWGKDDKATLLKSGKKIHDIMKNSYFFELEGDHFFFLDKADFIETQIIEIIGGK